MVLQDTLDALEQQLRDALRIAVESLGSIRFRSSYADGTWDVTLNANGSVTYGGYAEETRGLHGTLDQLQRWELLALAESGAEQQKKRT